MFTSFLCHSRWFNLLTVWKNSQVLRLSRVFWEPLFFVFFSLGFFSTNTIVCSCAWVGRHVHWLAGWLCVWGAFIKPSTQGWLDLGWGGKLSRRSEKYNLCWYRVGVGPFNAQQGTASVTPVHPEPSSTHLPSGFHLLGLEAFVYPLTYCQTITLVAGATRVLAAI